MGRFPGLVCLLAAANSFGAADGGVGEATLRVKVTTVGGRRTQKFALRLEDGGSVFALEKLRLGEISEVLPNVAVGFARLEGRFTAPSVHCQVFDVEARPGDQTVELTQQPVRTISGRVLHDGKPVAGVLVAIDERARGRDRCASRTSLTDSRGRFQSNTVSLKPVVVTARGVTVPEAADGGELIINAPDAVAGIHGRFVGARTLFADKRLSLVVPTPPDSDFVNSAENWFFDVKDDGVFGFDEAPDGGVGFLLSAPEDDDRHRATIDTFFMVDSPARDATIDLSRMGILFLPIGEGGFTWGTLVFPNGIRHHAMNGRLRLPEGPVQFWYVFVKTEPDTLRETYRRCEILSAKVVRGRETRIKIEDDPRNPVCPEEP